MMLASGKVVHDPQECLQPAPTTMMLCDMVMDARVEGTNMKEVSSECRFRRKVRRSGVFVWEG